MGHVGIRSRWGTHLELSDPVNYYMYLFNCLLKLERSWDRVILSFLLGASSYLLSGEEHDPGLGLV